MAEQTHILAWVIAVFSFVALATPAQAQNAEGKPASFLVYVGTYTGAKSKGIYLYRMNLSDGSLKSQGCVAELTHPTFLTIHPSGKFLYSVSEVGDYGGMKSGAVAGYAIDPATGKLTPINKQRSGGPGACFVSVDQTGKNVLVANYGGGSVEVIPIDENGKLAEPSCFIQHQGALGPNKQRQEHAHAHSINLDPSNRFAFVADLGMDKVMIYRFDPEKGTLTANDPAFATLAPGAGPRHLAFSPGGKFAYVNGEMGGTVTAFAYDATRGALTEIQTLSTLPPDFKGENTTAEVQVHPSGKFVYVSNRGHDSIAIFAANPQTGKLTTLGHESTQGKTPRNFRIDPTGTYLIAANQGSDSLVVFRISPDDGKLTPNGQKYTVGNPVCIKFLLPQ